MISRETLDITLFRVIVSLLTQRVLGSYIVESRVSIIGSNVMVWVSVPKKGT